MLKELFRFSMNDESSRPEPAVEPSGLPDHTRALAKLAEEFDRGTTLSAVPAVSAGPVVSERPLAPAFDQIYQTAALKPPRLNYSILKVSDMLNSHHLAAMSSDAKRCSLMMALEAAGVEVEDLLQDAVVRQRALNDFEDSQQAKLKELEAAKGAENRQIQAELDRLTNQYMSLIQANIDSVAREQDRFHAWQRTKQQEVQRIADAAAFCVPPGSAAANGGLSAVLERATALHK